MNLTDMDKSERLSYWQDLFSAAQEEYMPVIENLSLWWDQYLGLRTKATTGIYDKTYGGDDTMFPLVRNFTFELIESQIDSTIPVPKVLSPTKNRRKMRNARVIEAAIKTFLKKNPMLGLNDKEERLVKALGGSFRTVFWDNDKGGGGDVDISLLSPLQVIPQPGIYEIEDMDYVFVTHRETKKFLNKKYGVDLSPADTDNEVFYTLNQYQYQYDEGLVSDEVITQVYAYYKNDEGRLGVFSWAANEVLIDEDDYNARSEYICKSCGRSKPFDSDKCVCGSSEFEKRTKDFEELDDDFVYSFSDETLDENIPAKTLVKAGNISDSNFNIGRVDGGIDTNGDYFAYEKTKIPYYVPKVFPVMIRRNVSVFGQLLGDSDCDKIRDMQVQHNNLAIKVQEKIMKGGSVLTLPKGVKIETSDREGKVVYLSSAAQKQMIDAFSLQPSVQQDLQMLQKYYEDARSTLGITDSYQGKQDVTAQSGIAKQTQIAQAQGRLECKHAMKEQSYIYLFRAIFQYLLAYSDEPVDVVGQNEDGEEETFTFNRYDFLKRLPSGEYVYDDDYIFDVDSSGGLMQNRQAMWQEIRGNYQAGLFGNPQDESTLLLLWQQLETADYPGAGAMVKYFRDKKEQAQQALAEQQAAQQIQNQVPIQGKETVIPDGQQTAATDTVSGEISPQESADISALLAEVGRALE